jgi:hypothetical protein
MLAIQMKEIGSKSLWQWHINTIIDNLDIIHCPVFFIKNNVLETGFCLRPQVKTLLTTVGPNRQS